MRIVARPKPSCGSIFSQRILLKRSDQLSSATTRTPSRTAARARASRSSSRLARSIPAWRSKASHKVKTSGSSKASAIPPRHRKLSVPAARAAATRSPAQSSTTPRQGLPRPIPFEHGKLGMMQRPALAVAKDPGESENPLFPRREQLLAGEFRRGMKEKPAAYRRRRRELGRESADMGLVAAARPADAAVSTSLKPSAAKKRRDARSCARRLEKGLAVGIDFPAPPGRSARHYLAASRHLALATTGLRPGGEDRYCAAREPSRPVFRPPASRPAI